MGKRHDDSAKQATAQLQGHKSHNCRSSPLKIERVGGGYSIQLDPAAVSQTYLASCETLNALPAPEGPYTDYDLSILLEILQLAHAAVQQDFEAGRGSNIITLVKVLQAYEVVLPNHGIVPSEDVHYYRALLKLSLDPNPDWFAKLQQLRPGKQRTSGRRKVPRNKHSKTASGAGAATGFSNPGKQPDTVLASAVTGQASRPQQQQGSDTRQQEQPAADATAIVAVPTPPKWSEAGTAANGADVDSLPAIEAAAAAVDAASAAVAAALLQSGVRLADDNSITAAATGSPLWSRIQQHHTAVTAGSWAGTTADDVGAPTTNSLPGDEPAGDPGDNSPSSWSDLLAAVAAVEADGGILQQSSQTCNNLTIRHRARSLSPGPVNGFVPGGNTTAITISRDGIRQRSRSVSPYRISPQHGRLGSKNGLRAADSEVHEHHTPNSHAAAAARFGHFQAPTTAAAVSSFSPAFGTTAWKTSAAGSLPDVPVSRSHTRSASPWKAEAATRYLSDLALDQYVRFSRRMSSQQDWRQKLQAAQEARDLHVAAEHRWRLAMCFWEVHCVWRFFRRWRSWAALSAEESSASYRHWLLLCSFRWWMAMVQHYRRQRQLQEQQKTGAAAADAAAAAVFTEDSEEQQQEAGRPCSPLTRISRLLQQQPHLRPTTSTAGTLRQLASGRVVVGCVFTAWLQLVQQRREAAHAQSLLAWHHIQHVQAGVWNRWRTRFENSNTYHKLMRVVYQGRRHSALRRVVNHWRTWAPHKRTKRRRLRDAQTQLTISKRSRLWQAFRQYTAKRRVSRQRTAIAFQHFRLATLHGRVQQWAHILDIKDAFEQLASGFEEGVVQRRAVRMLQWWREWLQLQKQKYDREEGNWNHMAAYKALRCLAVWQGLVARRQQLMELEQIGQQISVLAAGRAAFRAWHEVVMLRKRHQDTMLAIITSVLRRQLLTAWSSWTTYVSRRQQQKDDLQELSEVNRQRIWQQSFTAWRSALQEKFQLAQAVETLTTNMLRRSIQHWKAWVDQKVDWRNFEAVAMQTLLRTRLATLLQQWHAVAARKSSLRSLLGQHLQASMQKQLRQAFSGWHDYLAKRVAKRMNQLSALLHWEQSVLRKAMRVWRQRTEVWRWKRMRRLRADSYHALRLMDLALTSWTSLWVEGQEFKQKAAFYVIGRQTELRVRMLRTWKEEAAWIRLKRERLDIAALHSVVMRQHQVIVAWRAEAAHRLELRNLVMTCIQRWSHMTVACAFEQWRSWALEEAALHRKARAVMALLAGRTQQWAFSMLREHALRKRRSRSAHHYRQQRLALSVVKAWQQQVSDALGFREVLVSVGLKMQQGLLAEVIAGWRDLLQAKHWKEAVLMRALVQWGGNRKKLCFQAWRQWTAMKQGRKASLGKALNHWHHLYLQQSFKGWKQHIEHKKVAAAVLEHFRLRRLQLAVRTWRAWYERKAYLAAMFNKLQGRGHQQVLRVVWKAWKAFVPSRQQRRQELDRANTHRHRRQLAVCFFAWGDYAAYRAHKHEQYVTAQLHWRRRRRAKGFRAWKQVTEVELYRRHMVEVVSGKLTNALTLRAINAWRDLVFVKQTRREQSAAAYSHWVKHELIKAFTLWREETREAIVTRRVLAHWQDQVLSKAWAAWREVVDQRHQVATRLRGVASQMAKSDLRRVLDGWQKVVMRQQLARTVVEERNAKIRVGCLRGWRAVAAQLRDTADKVHTFRARSIHQLAVSILRIWADLAWELPRERQAADFEHKWLKQRSLWGWFDWVRLKIRWQQLESDVAAHWCNLHLAAAWRVWREFMQQRQRKQQQVDEVARRWRNLHLAAAFQGWYEWLHVSKFHGHVQQTVAGRWRNLHTAAALGAWKSYVAQKHARRAASEAAAQRWNNLHLAAAFGAWKDATRAAADHLATAEAVAQQKLVDIVAVAFLEWRDQAAQHAEVLQRANRLARRRQRAQLQAVFESWWELLQQQMQQQADEPLWSNNALQQDPWQLVVPAIRQLTTEDDEPSQLQQDILMRFATRKLRLCLRAWHKYSKRLVQASLLLRRQLIGTLQGAFHEWRAVAVKQAHWHMVEKRLVEFIRSDSTSTSKVAEAAAARWLNWPLSLAFSTWQANTAAAEQERQDEYRAVKFLCYALTLKALTGFRWAVQEARVHNAADEHREGARKRAVLRAWVIGAERVKDKRRKLMAAQLSYSTRLSRKAFNVWIVYTQYKQHKVDKLARAEHYDRLASKAGAFRAWLQVTRYLVPLRSNLLQLQRKRHRKRLRQFVTAWQLHTHMSKVLQQAIGRRKRAGKSRVLAFWREFTLEKIRLKELLHATVARLNQLRSLWALQQWHDTTHQLQKLRAKAQLVLKRMFERRMHGAVTAWRAEAGYQIAKRAMVAKGLQYYRRLYAVKTLVSWAAFVQEARHFQDLSQQMLHRRQQKQRQHMLYWWHLIAQDLHHHRVVLDYFRARNIRRDGVGVFWHWREWAHERMLERKAVVSYWNRLLVTAFAAWLEQHEDIQWEKAAAHYAAKLTARGKLAWKVAMALIHRKRVLSAAAEELNLWWCVRKAMNSWLRYTYYMHMGHVALHFRIRRLCCVVLREWQQAAQTQAEERIICLELVHNFATNRALAVLTDWQLLVAARHHYSKQRLTGCFGFWGYWAPEHAAKNAKWRQVAAQIQSKQAERCFYTWRWYAQVRVLRSVAFQHKQRAVREAVAIGEQVARRKRLELMASTFMAWHVQVRKYRKVAEKLAGLLQHNLSTCLRAWRAAADEAHVNWLRAERHAATSTLAKFLPAWADTASELRADREAAESVANRFFRKRAYRRVITAWVEEMQVVREQRRALWALVAGLLQHQRQCILKDVLQGWHETVQQHIALRDCVASFVNKRRLECLSEYLTIWHQYAAAMQTDGLVLPVAASPAVKDVSSSGAVSPAISTMRPASAAADFYPARGSMLPASSAGFLSQHQQHLGSGGSALGSAVLPVTGGPGSPVLGFRSAHGDRRLARRLAAMGGGAQEVDPGSDDEQQLFTDLPATAAAAAAAERQERQQPLLALSKGYRQRRTTLNDDRAQYDDAVAATAASGSGGRYISPRFDLHSVADSMRLVHEQGLSPWQLPTVRASPPPKVHQDTLTLEQLRQYQHQYPYSLPNQQQQRAEQPQQQYSGMLGVVGRPGSAGGFRKNYQPLLQQQLDMHEQRLEAQRWQLQQQQEEMQRWQQQRSQQGTPLGSPLRRQQQQQGSRTSSPISRQQLGQEHGSRSATPGPQQQQQQDYLQHQQPWHESPGRNKKWYENVQNLADTHWQERRGHILSSHKAGNNSSDSSTLSSRSETPSSASSLVGSDADAAARQQQYILEQQQMQHGLYGKWAVKAWERPGSADPSARSALSLHRAAAAGTADVSSVGGQSGLEGQTFPRSSLVTSPQSRRDTSVSSAGPSRMSVGARAQIAMGQPTASAAGSRGGVHRSPGRNTVA